MRFYSRIGFLSLWLLVLLSPFVVAQTDKARAAVNVWTPQAIREAVPRDYLIGDNHKGYIRDTNGQLFLLGSKPQTLKAVPLNAIKKPLAKPIIFSDSEPPIVSNHDPSESMVIGNNYIFSAQVTDTSGVKSVVFHIRYPDSVTEQSFTASYIGDDRWAVSLQGFYDGDWQWWVIAKDGSGRGGNTTDVPEVINFSVAVGNVVIPPVTSEDTVVNDEWDKGGVSQSVLGRIYFQMPSNSKRKGPWSGYVCSGSVVSDSVTGRSLILTAAHCIYDDVNKAFARNVLFIPNQSATTASGTDLDCDNDPVGCWVPDFGVVDRQWTLRTFPDNVAWDYGFYVVGDIGAHIGSTASSESLDMAVGSLAMSFLTPSYDDGDPGKASLDFTYALGYSYAYDPKLMYCAEDLTQNTGVNWWIPSCELSGGASGGAWLQPLDENSGGGTIISLNSWGYTSAPGMAGPRLDVSSAACLFSVAQYTFFNAVSNLDGDQGVVQSCP
ncbi:hypothetical protein [Teredinibacter sp. KSP-S5-2]|uniref:trypsin-like serine peptidase n=1 Tax=Teredinibacter sp. KSP-S5-2 TaxID=3034506 RepID=UPI0029348909|nr:hypothetical protein [Teredinibacter sp. KSP-S5-2]WNO08355.1 hypothetical protein P5V12_15395 [Teredinibacter sp. KSP-S5-2]